MAGHNKWSKVKHRKAVVDKRRSKAWTMCSRAIISAARQHGPDPAFNIALRAALEEAWYHKVPNEHVERAIKKGAAGGGEGAGRAGGGRGRGEERRGGGRGVRSAEGGDGAGRGVNRGGGGGMGRGGEENGGRGKVEGRTEEGAGGRKGENFEFVR